MRFIVLRLVSVVIGLYSILVSSNELDSITYTLAHSLSINDEFTPHGDVTIALSSASTSSSSDNRLTLKLGQKSYDVSNDSRLYKAIETGAPYRAKVFKASASGEKVEGVEEEVVIMSSVNMCELAASEFKENLVFHLYKPNTIMGVNVKPVTTPTEANVGQQCKNAEFRKALADKVSGNGEKVVTFRTKASVALPREIQKAPYGFHAMNGQLPEKAAASESGAPEVVDELFQEKKTEKKPEEEEESQSFLRKYWYVFAPLFIMQVAGNFLQAPQAEDGAQPPGTAAAVAAPKGKGKQKKK